MGLLIISFSQDPYNSSVQVKYLFFTSLFMSLWGLSTLVLNKFKLKMDWPDFYKSFKIGLIISALLVFGLLFARLLR